MAGLHCSFCGATLEALTIACSSCGAQPLLGERYEVRALIGRGGMGEVFLGFDRRLDSEVAIKRLPPQFAANPELRDSLQKEGRILARLSDAAIVRLFDLAEFYGDTYLILEYVCGPSLREMIKAGYKPSVQEVAQLIGQICQGLTEAHRANVIHRDLKPSNLLLALHGPDRPAFVGSRRLPGSLASARVKIADFGIAKAIADAPMTFTNAFSGTPGYMAPEQFRGEQPSPETDVYALGVITHELLTGTLPGQPVPQIPEIHPAVTEVIAKAMSPYRQYRFPTAAAYCEALYSAIEGRSPIRPLPVSAPPPRNSMGRVFAAVGIAFLAIFLIGAVSYTVDKLTKKSVRSVEPAPEPMEWHSPPRVTELPPVIAEARGIRRADNALGPEHPKVKWSVPLPMGPGAKIEAIGVDGTLYIKSLSQLAAIRNGKLLWAYNIPMMSWGFQFDDDGRLWISATNAVFCLNRDGKGGRLPAETKAPVRRIDKKVDCVAGTTIAGTGWRMEVDGQCSTSTVVQSRDGTIYAGTDSPQVLSLQPTGKVNWNVGTTCTPQILLPVAPDQVVFSCGYRTIHGIAHGAERWLVTGDALISSGMQADKAGSVYWADSTGQIMGSHLHSIGVDGRERWKLDVGNGTVNNMAIGDNKEIYVATSLMQGKLICYGD